MKATTVRWSLPPCQREAASEPQITRSMALKPQKLLRAALTLPFLISLVTVTWRCATAMPPTASPIRPLSPAAGSKLGYALDELPAGPFYRASLEHPPSALFGSESLIFSLPTTSTIPARPLDFGDQSLSSVNLQNDNDELPELAEQQPAEEPPPKEPPLPGDGPTMPGELAIKTTHLDLYVGRWTFSADLVRTMSESIELALAEAEQLLGTQLQARTSVAFYRPSLSPISGVRGLAYTEERMIEVFYSPEEDPERAIAVVAHELGHQLEADRYGAAVQERADTILHEGLATWLASRRWLALRGAESWRERGRQLMDSGRLLSLLRDPPGSAANDAYDGWASFVDYLISTYGWVAFDDLYRSGRGRYPGSADYLLVYGRSLDELADDWRAWLRH